MKNRPKKLTDTVVVRLTPELREVLERDARENERNVSQSIRFHLRHLLLEKK